MHMGTGTKLTSVFKDHTRFIDNGNDQFFAEKV